MNLTNLSDQNLLQTTKQLREQEREIITKLLRHLREIERRRLFSDLKCTSLFDYAVKELKYSEKEACLRISAMRLMRDLPEIEDKITEGSLSLTNLNLAQNLFKKEKQSGRKLDAHAKASFIKQLENKSTRQAIKIATSVCPEFRPTSKFDFNSIEDDGLREKLLKAKGRLAHIDPHMDLTALLHKLCDEFLERPMREPKRKSPPAREVKPSKAQINREVWRRDQARCSHCNSTYAIEKDHRSPRSLGGQDTPENLRLLCRSCNQRAAIKIFGQRHMDKYLRTLAHTEA